MKTPELPEPVFPLKGGSSAPPLMRAPRLIIPGLEPAVDGRIFPGAWSAQRAPTIHPGPPVPPAAAPRGH